MLTVCIGFDPRETIAYHVLAHSIMRRASAPVRIMPLMLSQLNKIFTRERSPDQSTDFTYSRFLTPWFGEPNSTSVFLDCDMLCLTDICELEKIAWNDRYKDVFVVQHDYEPKTTSKFLGATQTTYPCKNWSSMMVFNGHRQPVKNLTLEVVNTAPSMHLHQFRWADAIGSLDASWNHLVSEYPYNPDAKIVHFTLGGPWFEEYSNCEYSNLWFAELKDLLHCQQR